MTSSETTTPTSASAPKVNEKMAIHGAIEKAPTRTYQLAVYLTPEHKPLWNTSFMTQVLTSAAVLAKMGGTQEQLDKKADEGVQVLPNPREIIADGDGGSGRTHFVGVCNMVDQKMAEAVVNAFKPVSLSW